ncbi:hypothetical protein MMC13_006525 [Lambiella insularis]|nr:hypothetical protein [Lambiella insularis]
MAAGESEPKPQPAIEERNHAHKDKCDQLQELIAQATANYAVKDYDAAAELYSRATELQAELNGEMSPQNANLLYSYGRCLYHVAVSNSDVLGSKVAGEKREDSKKSSKDQKSNGQAEANTERKEVEQVAEEGIAAIATTADQSTTTDDEKHDSKAYFTFTGDENFDDSDDEEVEATVEDGDAEAEIEEDDFSNAYEVLDLARLLLQRRLEELQEEGNTGKAVGDPEVIRQLKERLADTYDLQAEISLEGERFPNAVVDLRAALKLKEELFSHDSSLIAEAHYKLSLSLEFSSVTQQKDGNGEVDASQTAHVDEAMREEAALEMEAAITSCKTRIEREEAALASNLSINGNTDRPKVTREGIDDVKEMVKDMEQRLVELRQGPVSINDPRGTGAIDGATPLSGILGSILGESPEAQKARIEEASQSAKDLTNLVRRKRPAGSEVEEMPEKEVTSSGKRKVSLTSENVLVKKLKQDNL